MAVVASGIFIALVLFIVLMWLRIVVDWVRILRAGWRPRGLVLIAAEASFTATDPVISLVRRIVPPVRMGQARLDFSASIVLLLALGAVYIVAPLTAVPG